MDNSKEFKWNDILACEWAGYLESRIKSGLNVGNIPAELLRWKESKRPKILLKTEDEINLNEGDPFWYVNTHVWDIQALAVNTSNIEYAIEINQYKAFSSRKKADEFLLSNKPIFSLKEILELPFHNFTEVVKSIAKQKIQGDRQ